jgi:hypothetical protein
MNDDNFNVILKGEGICFPKIIKLKNPLKKDMTILELYIFLIKIYKKVTSSIYLYVILSDDFCGFIPLPNQTLEELAINHGNNNCLILKITDKPYFG